MKKTHSSTRSLFALWAFFFLVGCPWSDDEKDRSATSPAPQELVVTTSAAPSSGVLPVTVTFNSIVSGGTAPYTYSWSFGDGGSEIESTASHTYQLVGNYSVILQVTDAAGTTKNATPLQIQVSENTGSQPLPADIASAPSSRSLINKALEDGKIDTETALKYKVFAVFADERLPAEYRAGLNMDGSGTTVILELARRFNTLSPEAQDAMRPFLVSPLYAESWYAHRKNTSPTANQSVRRALPQDASPPCIIFGDWEYLDTIDGKIRYWWDKNRPEDGDVARLLIGVTSRLAAMRTLMGREPLSDSGITGLCDGGSPALDVMLIRKGWFNELRETIFGREFSGFAESSISLPGSPKSSSITIFVDPPISTSWLREVMIHEYMHTIQYAFSHPAEFYSDLSWLMEASASWAEGQYLADDNQTVARLSARARAYVQEPWLPLPRHELSGTKGPQYNSFLFFTYLSNRFSPSIIKDIWTNVEDRAAVESFGETSILGSISVAINDAQQAAGLPRGALPEIWVDFVTANWGNRFLGDTAPTFNRISGFVNFAEADLAKGIASGKQHVSWLQNLKPASLAPMRSPAPVPPTSGGEIVVDLQGKSERTYWLNYDVAAYAAHYYVFNFDDLDISSITLYNATVNDPQFSQPGIYVQPIVQINSDWKLMRDMESRFSGTQGRTYTTGENGEYLTWCKDYKKQRINRLVLIVTAPHGGTGVRQFSPQLHVSNLGCWAWHGTSRQVNYIPFQDDHGQLLSQDEFKGSARFVAALSDVEFETRFTWSHEGGVVNHSLDKVTTYTDPTFKPVTEHYGGPGLFSGAFPVHMPRYWALSSLAPNRWRIPDLKDAQGSVDTYFDSLSFCPWFGFCPRSGGGVPDASTFGVVSTDGRNFTGTLERRNDRAIFWTGTMTIDAERE